MQSLALLVVQLVIVISMVLLMVLPVVALILFWAHRRTGQHAVALKVTGLILAGFLMGGTIGWQCRPDAWTMPLWQTAEASGNAEKYGHPLESQAERVMLYLVFGGVMGAAVAGLAAPLMVRYWPIGRPPSGLSASASGTCK